MLQLRTGVTVCCVLSCVAGCLQENHGKNPQNRGRFKLGIHGKLWHSVIISVIYCCLTAP